MSDEMMTREEAIRIGVTAAIEQVDFWDAVIRDEGRTRAGYEPVSAGSMERSQARARIIDAAAFLVAERVAVKPVNVDLPSDITIGPDGVVRLR